LDWQVVTKKKIIENELIKELISIRVDTLWKMLSQIEAGFFPGPYEEGATGKFDNKGAIFIPGGLIYQDVDEMPISYQSHGRMTADVFRKKLRKAMQNDNATLLFPDGIATGVNLDGGFFSKAARLLYTFKKASFRRKRKIGPHKHLKIISDDIIRSHCPTYMPHPYGARTRISTCASVGLIDPPLFFSYCETLFNLSHDQAERFAQGLDKAQDPVKADNATILYPPYIVVCHDTRYKDNSLTGLTRILGIGKFGEFATFTLEQANKSLFGELKRKKQDFASEDIFATYENIEVLGILRIYSPTNPGKRLLRYSLHIVSPEKDLDLNINRLKKEAQKRYHLFDK
jgi:hypothetical protein